jgi:hypothetical protein
VCRIPGLRTTSIGGCTSTGPATSPGYTCEYRVTRLVYFECHASIRAGVERERKIKGWRRAKKLALIEAINSGWLDLAADWFPALSRQGPSLRSG